LDQRTSPAKYLTLNPTAAFITRFIVMRVDTGLIPGILSSEYGGTANFAADVQTVLGLLSEYLELDEPAIFKRRYGTPNKLGSGNHPGNYTLDFSVNWFGTGFIKGPI